MKIITDKLRMFLDHFRTKNMRGEKTISDVFDLLVKDHGGEDLTQRELRILDRLMDHYARMRGGRSEDLELQGAGTRPSSAGRRRSPGASFARSTNQG